MKIKHLIIGALLVSYRLSAQVGFTAATHLGHSTATENLMPSKFVFGGGIGINGYFMKRIQLVTGFSYSRLQTENELIDVYRIRQLNLGLGVDLLKEKHKLLLVLSGLTSECRFAIDNSSLPEGFADIEDSRWTQWGYAGELQYFPKKYWGVSLGYTRYCARRYDVLNFQDIVKAGVIFRLERVKLNEESK